MPQGNSYVAPELPLTGTEQITGFQQQGGVVKTVTMTIEQITAQPFSIIDGDLEITALGHATVIGINGHPLGDTTPTNGNVLVANGTDWVSETSSVALDALSGLISLPNVAAISNYRGVAGTTQLIRTAGYFTPGDGGGADYTQTNTGFPNSNVIPGAQAGGGYQDANSNLWYLSDVFSGLGNMVQAGCQPNVDLSAILPVFATWLAGKLKSLFTPKASSGDWLTNFPMTLPIYQHLWEKGSKIIWQPMMSSFMGSVAPGTDPATGFTVGILTVPGTVTGLALAADVPLYTYPSWNQGQVYIVKALTATTFVLSKSFTHASTQIYAAGPDNAKVGMSFAITYGPQGGPSLVENSCVVGPDGGGDAIGSLSGNWVNRVQLGNPPTGTNPQPSITGTFSGNVFTVNSGNGFLIQSAMQMINSQLKVTVLTGPNANTLQSPPIVIMSVGSGTMSFGGTTTIGDVVSITATDSALTGSPITVSHTVIPTIVGGTTPESLSTVVSALTTLLKANTNLASATSYTSSGTTITVKYLTTAAYGIAWTGGSTGTETFGGFTSAGGTPANPILTFNVTPNTITGSPTFYISDLPNYSALARGVGGICVGGNTKIHMKSDASIDSKFGIVINSYNGHNIFDDCNTSGAIAGLYWMVSGGDDLIIGGGYTGCISGILFGNTNLTNTLAFSGGGIDATIVRTQVQFVIPWGIKQICQNRDIFDGCNGVSLVCIKTKFESPSEAAIECLPGAKSYLNLIDCADTPGQASSFLPPDQINNPRVNLFNLGEIDGLATNGSGSGAPWAPDTTAGSNYAQFTFAGSWQGGVTANFEPRFLGTPTNIVTNGTSSYNRWLTQPDTVDLPSKGDFQGLQDLATKGNLLLNGENATNWVQIPGAGGGTITSATSGPFSSSDISGIVLTTAQLKILGPNPTVTKITVASGSIQIYLPSLDNSATVAPNQNLWMRLFIAGSAGLAINPSLRFDAISNTSGIRGYAYPAVTPGLASLVEFLGVDKTPEYWGETLGNLYGLALSAGAPGSIYIIGAQAGYGEVAPYNPQSGARATKGLWLSDPSEVLPSYAEPFMYSDPEGNIYMSAPPADGTLKITTPTAGGSYTILQLCKSVHFTNAASVAGYTITAPTPPTTLVTETIPLELFFKSAITSLAWTAPTGITFTGAALPTSVAAGAKVSLQYFPTTTMTGEWFHTVGA